MNNLPDNLTSLTSEEISDGIASLTGINVNAELIVIENMKTIEANNIKIHDLIEVQRERISETQCSLRQTHAETERMQRVVRQARQKIKEAEDKKWLDILNDNDENIINEG